MNIDEFTIKIMFKQHQNALNDLRDTVMLLIEGIAIIMVLLLFINIMMIHQLKKLGDEGIKHIVLVDDLNLPHNLNQIPRPQATTVAPEESDPVHHESEGKED